MQGDGPCARLPLQTSNKSAAVTYGGLRTDDLSDGTSLGEILTLYELTLLSFVSFLFVCNVLLSHLFFSLCTSCK